MNMVWRVIQRGDVGITLPTGFEEEVAVLHAHLLQGLQAVSGKAGTGSVYMRNPCFGPLLQGLIRIRLQPFLWAKTRLEGVVQFCFIQFQRSSDKAGCFLALLAIRIPLLGIA